MYALYKKTKLNSAAIHVNNKGGPSGHLKTFVSSLLANGFLFLKIGAGEGI